MLAAFTKHRRADHARTQTPPLLMEQRTVLRAASGIVDLAYFDDPDESKALPTDLDERAPAMLHAWLDARITGA